MSWVHRVIWELNAARITHGKLTSKDLADGVMCLGRVLLSSILAWRGRRTHANTRSRWVLKSSSQQQQACVFPPWTLALVDVRWASLMFWVAPSALSVCPLYPSPGVCLCDGRRRRLGSCPSCAHIHLSVLFPTLNHRHTHAVALLFARSRPHCSCSKWGSSLTHRTPSAIDGIMRRLSSSTTPNVVAGRGDSKRQAARTSSMDNGKHSLSRSMHYHSSPSLRLDPSWSHLLRCVPTLAYYMRVVIWFG